MLNYIIDFIMKNLPVGGGIDCDWNYELNKKRVVFINSFHNMNDDGYYDGFQDFKVIIPINSTNWEADFILQFTGRRTKYIFGLDEFLQDTFAQALEDIGQELEDRLTLTPELFIAKKLTNGNI